MTVGNFAYHGEPQLLSRGRVGLIVQPYSFMNAPGHTSLVVHRVEQGGSVLLNCDGTTIEFPASFVPLLIRALGDLDGSGS